MSLSFRYPLDVAERHFSRLIRDGGASPPALDDATFWWAEVDREHSFLARLSDGHRFQWLVRPGYGFERPVTEGSAAWYALRRDLRGLYSRLYENHLLDLQLEPLRRTVRDLHALGAHPHLIEEAHRTLAAREEYLRRHHREPPTVSYFGSDRAVEPDFTVLVPVGIGPEGPINELRARIERDASAAWRGAANQAPEPPTALTVEHVRHAREMLQRNADSAFQQQYRREFISQFERGQSWLAGAVGSPEAREKAEKLLLDWLAPDQRAHYLKDRSFIVIGGETKKRYRINHGRQMNIHELDGDDRPVCGLCFLPEGALVEGDVMLAQKIALETNERAALKVANKFALDWPGPNLTATQVRALEREAWRLAPSSRPGPPPPG